MCICLCFDQMMQNNKINQGRPYVINVFQSAYPNLFRVVKFFDLNLG